MVFFYFLERLSVANKTDSNQDNGGQCFFFKGSFVEKAQRKMALAEVKRYIDSVHLFFGFILAFSDCYENNKLGLGLSRLQDNPLLVDCWRNLESTQSVQYLTWIRTDLWRETEVLLCA